MKLFLLKILLQRRARDEGFTLPMVIALGLVMLLLGTVNIVKSNEENITAINTNSSSDALAMAEVGIARYRELLNQNRILTVYNHEHWDNNAVAVDFLDTGTNFSTRNINVRGQACNNMNRTPPGWFDDNSNSTNVKPNNTDTWWEVKQNLTDDSIGEYKLVSYRYHHDNNLANDDSGQFVPDDDNVNITDSFAYNDDDYNPRGILTVQGRSSDGSEAQIEVEIPLRINDLENFAPVLWVKSGAIANPGTLNVDNDDNIVLRQPPANNGCSSPAAIAGNDNVISDPRFMPGTNFFSNAEIPAIKRNTLSAVNRDTTSAQVILPIPQSPPDRQDDDGRFIYQFTGDLIVNRNNLVTDGSAKVILRVAGNISITAPAGGGTLTVGNENAANQRGNFANFNNGDTTNTNVSSQNLELYVLGRPSDNRTITINPNGGTVNIEAFIHAPNSTLEVTGTGTVNINGAVWVNEYVNNTAGAVTVNIRSDQTDTTTGTKPSYKFYSTSEFITPRPITSSPTEWKREEVN